MVTKDAAAADPHCPETVRKAFTTLFRLGKDEAGRKRLREQLRLCSVPMDSAGVTDVGYWIQVAFGKYRYCFVAQLSCCATSLVNFYTTALGRSGWCAIKAFKNLKCVF